MPDDPWSQLETPRGLGAFTARLVSSDETWNFYWAVDLDGHRVLLLRHSGVALSADSLPKLWELEVFDAPAQGATGRMLVLRLMNPVHQEVFLQFCLDVISWARGAGSEADAVGRVVSRTWRWHHLLRSGSEGRLSVEAQKGLIGELCALEQCLLPNLTARSAVESWIGPLGGHRDFESGLFALEAKARSLDHPFVAISSEFQLDGGFPERLFLFVVTVDRAGTEAGETLTGIARGVAARLKETDQATSDLFDDRLTAAGFTWDQDYSDILWLVGSWTAWEVREPFPRVRATELPEGVSEVTYTLGLTHLEPCHSEPGDIALALGGSTG